MLGRIIYSNIVIFSHWNIEVKQADKLIILPKNKTVEKKKKQHQKTPHFLKTR